MYWTSIPFWAKRLSFRFFEILYSLVLELPVCDVRAPVLSLVKVKKERFTTKRLEEQLPFSTWRQGISKPELVMCYFVGTVRINHSTSMDLWAIQLIFYS